MTRDDIIRMAREAKIDQLWGDDPLADWSVELTIFAALVAAAERERVTFELFRKLFGLNVRRVPRCVMNESSQIYTA